MQLREHYRTNRKYFWLYSAGVFALATLAVWAGGSRGDIRSTRSAPAEPVQPPVVEVTSALQEAPAPRASEEPARPWLNHGIVPGRKDDTNLPPQPER